MMVDFEWVHKLLLAFIIQIGPCLSLSQTHRHRRRKIACSEGKLKPWTKNIVQFVWSDWINFSSQSNQNAKCGVGCNCGGSQNVVNALSHYIQQSFELQFCTFHFTSAIELTIWQPQQSTNVAVSKLHILINFISSLVIKEIDFDGPLDLLTALIWYRSLIGSWKRAEFSKQLAVSCCM